MTKDKKPDPPKPADKADKHDFAEHRPKHIVRDADGVSSTNTPPKPPKAK